MSKEGHNKEQKNSRDLGDAEEIKKRWKKYMEELYKKNILMNQIAKTDSYILECEVKWTLESTAVNNASGGDYILVQLFKTLKDDAIKVLHSICQQSWKTQQ